MRKTVLAMAFCSVVLGATAASAAEVNYQSSQVVDFFIKSTLGVERGICVGTPAECEARAKPAGFDMMINFELDSADLTDTARGNLLEISRALKDDRLLSAAFNIEGYTDALGSDGYNMSLSERRAGAVRTFLVSEGIDPARLTAIGFGEASPRDPDPLADINRRVEMRIKLQ
ncbi:flagellar motor protein MotB [Nostoc sp. 3335mG]|nr:flagellar motor protein MotB [Nostoc sp. 3335mG]